MDADRFDTLVRFCVTGSSRRGLLGALAGLLGVEAVAFPSATSAKKRKKKVRRNTFGCVNVGRYCKRDNQCCSGICKGKKCKAHDTGGCAVGLTEAFCSGTDVFCQTTGGTGACNTTTGNAAFCTFAGTECDVVCTKDADCRSVCGPNAACVKCAVCSSGTSCTGPFDCF